MDNPFWMLVPWAVFALAAWVEVLAHHDPVPQEPAWHAITNRTLQTGPRADLGDGSAGCSEGVTL